MVNISFSLSEKRPWLPVALVIFSFGCLFIGGMTAVRLLYEGLFPAALWLGNTALAVLLAGGAAVVGVWWEARLFEERAAGALTPLLLNLVYLFQPGVDLTAGRFLFLASLWLTALFVAHYQGVLERQRWVGVGFVAAFLLPVYLLTLGQTVGTADTFEFQVVIPKLGIVHPTGYPLYLLLTKLFTFIPINSVAWRVNVGTAVYGVGAACLLYYFLKSLTGQRAAAVLGAVLFGLSPTFWSQSVQAEVYSLHALVVAAVLVVVGRIGEWRLDSGEERPAGNRKFWGMDGKVVLLAFLLGLGLTNHLTTMLLTPAVLIYWAAQVGLERREGWPFRFRQAVIIIAAFLVPLTLYLYLPIRWQAVNEEAMGLGRFVDWVVGGRFQGALNLTAVLSDPARVEVVGRLFTAEWGWGHLLIGVIGVIVLARKAWRAALFLALVWLGFAYYALSYYVPDLSVFLIPAHLVIAVLWGIGIGAAVRLFGKQGHIRALLVYPLLSVVMFFVFQQAASTWEAVDASQLDGGTRWGRAVLGQELDPEGAILADSVKFPPLYYLQQAERLRPEMDIVVLPDEAAYRAELDARLAAGQTVYLARFLPGLAGVYHLRSVGPLTEVRVEPLAALPDSAEGTATDVAFRPVELVGYELERSSPFEAGQTAVTFYWRTAEPVEDVWQVYVRWSGGQAVSQFPANNSYPTNAWRPGEIVVDFHELPRPILNEPAELVLEVALAPAFTVEEGLDWRRVTTAVWEPYIDLSNSEAVRAQIGPLLINEVSLVEQVRPGAELSVGLHGFGTTPGSLIMELVPADEYTPTPSDFERADAQSETAFTWSEQVSVDVETGSYLLVGRYPGEAAVCSWPAMETAGCVLSEVEVSGMPLPEGAVNFEDKIALLDVDVVEEALQPGGQLAVNLTWLGLGDMVEEYTVFVQVLDEQDRIVGQVDSWPLQGTFPTSQWAVGERVVDPYLVQLSEDLPPGQYRLHVGWYLLETLQRLAVLDESGTAVDDKVVVPIGEK